MKFILSAISVLIISLVLFNIYSNSSRQKIVTNHNYRYNASLLNEEHPVMIQKPFSVLLQYIAPQHGLSHLAGWLAESRIPWLKNYLIRYFLSRHDVDMSAAVVENPYDYPNFNSFFTRHLKQEARPIATLPYLASPVDGFVSQAGKIERDSILQAKGFNFTLASLLGGSEKLAALFAEGNFATFYLAPNDYHRVHMPIDGQLRETVFVPGNLFSVDQKTTASVPDLFARNERLVCIFDTSIGPMAVILVGAMLVGSIETVWHADTVKQDIHHQSFDSPVQIAHGAELGYFKMGSTVIILFGKDQVHWAAGLLQKNAAVKVGEAIGEINKKG